MQNYEQQADDFLRKTKSTLQVRYVRTGLFFNETDEKNIRDIYEFKLERNGRVYIAEFGDSLQNTWVRFERAMSLADNYKNPEKTFKLQYDKDGTRDAMKRYNKENNTLKATEWKYNKNKPTNYSILACLQSYEPPATFEDFINEFGYEIKGVKSYNDLLAVYGKVVLEWTTLLTLYNDKEMQELANIQ